MLKAADFFPGTNREVNFRYDLLNGGNVKIGEVPLLSATVRFNSLAQIKRTATFSLWEQESRNLDYLNDRIRPVMLLGGQEYPLGVFLLPSPARKAKGASVYREIAGYDLTQILLEDRFTSRYYLPAGTEYTEAVKRIVNSVGLLNMQIPASGAVLARDREYQAGTSKLDAINELLRECSYTSLWADAAGQLRAAPYVQPSLRQPDISYLDDGQSCIIADSEGEELDLFNIPNVFVVTSSTPDGGELSATYVNDSPLSPTSTVKRHRQIVDYREISDIAGIDELDAYVKRIAYAASSAYSTVSFDTPLIPAHGYATTLYITSSKLGIQGKYTETEWSMELKAGGRMTHKARRAIQL